MPTPPEDFRERIIARVRAHYGVNRTPLLLSHLGLEIEKNDEWPTDRGQRNLAKLIVDTCDPDLQIVRDRRSPAYIAVVTPDVRSDVEAQIAERSGQSDVVPVRLEDIAKPVLLAFCVSVQNQPVYVKGQGHSGTRSAASRLRGLVTTFSLNRSIGDRASAPIVRTCYPTAIRKTLRAASQSGLPSTASRLSSFPGLSQRKRNKQTAEDRHSIACLRLNPQMWPSD